MNDRVGVSVMDLVFAVVVTVLITSAVSHWNHRADIKESAPSAYGNSHRPNYRRAGITFKEWWATQDYHIEKASRNQLNDSALFYPIAKIAWEAALQNGARLKCMACDSPKVNILHQCEECASRIDVSNWRDRK